MDAEVGSHSVFLDNAHKKSTGLFEYLTENEITDVFIMGLTTKVCVKFTVLDFINLGFNTYVIQDGCRAVNNENGEKVFKEMKDATAIIINSDEIGE